MLFKRKRGKSAYQEHLDRLESLRRKYDPWTEEYKCITQAIKDLENEEMAKKKVARRFSDETRGTLGKICAVLIPGIAVTGFNYFMENRFGMLSGRRSKDEDSVMSGILRSLFRFGGGPN